MKQDPTEGGSASIVIDNAFLFSAANLYERAKRKLLARNVNILGLSALADAVVMHQRLTVDRKGWKYFSERVPPQWLAVLDPLADVIDFKLPKQETIVKRIMASDDCFLLCYTIAQLDHLMLGENKNVDMVKLYFAYTGHDLGYQSDETSLIEALERRMPSGIPDIDLYLRTSQHVGILQCLVRGLQYDDFAAGRGQPYLSHEFRGRILNALARMRAQPKYREMWDRLTSRIASSLKEEYGSTLSWLNTCQDSQALWEQFDTPLFMAAALQRSDSPEDLFHELDRIRNKALPLRQLLQEFVDTSDAHRPEVLKQIKGLSYEIESPRPIEKSTTLSASFGLPISASLGFDVPVGKRNRSAAFIRDIYDNHAIPATLAEDVMRVFGLNEVQGLVAERLRRDFDSLNARDEAGRRLLAFLENKDREEMRGKDVL